MNGHTLFANLRVRSDIKEPRDLGLTLDGLCVTAVQPNSIAAKMGIKLKDVITHCGDIAVSDWPALINALNTAPYHNEFGLTIKRKGFSNDYNLKPKYNLLTGYKPKFARFVREIHIPLDIGLLLEDNELVVTSVVNGSPAAGRIKTGDRITGFQDKEIKSWPDFCAVRDEIPFATAFSFKLTRPGKSGPETVNVTLELSKMKLQTSGGRGGAAGQFTKEIIVDGTMRKYMLQVPQPAAEGKVMPLVLLLHGTDSSPDYMLYHWQPVVTDTAILAAPWGDRNWDYETEAAKNKDEKFIGQMMEEIKKNYDINLAMVYVTGHSRGAIYTYYWGVTCGNVFAAAGMFAGALAHSAKPSKRKCPFIFYHGELDQAVPIAAGRAAEAALKGMDYHVEFIEEKGGTPDPQHHEMNRPGIEAIWKFFKRYTIYNF